MSFDDLPTGEYAFPGPLRDRLVAAILSGEKTATAWLAEEAERFDDEPTLPGHREVVVDSQREPVCVTEVTEVREVRLAEVDDAHARAEGEGHADAAAWREAHERFWSSPEFLEAIGDPPIQLDDDTPVVCCRFTVIHRF
ncbi:ASCH domain-containing protein [Luteococcus sp. Sow4_B9]|uniref:ASCH domain-containing protein n=1 Tax=Luteococcus sp. Sow4_B9 TaxID=3438792 RepID=UPI003F9C6455